MDLRAELAALKNRAIAAIEQAAKERDTTRIRVLSDLLAGIEGDEKAAVALQDRVRSHEVRLSSPDEMLREPPPRKTDARSRRERGNELREELARRHALTPEKGVIYRTRSDSRVGIVTATEDPKNHTWFLGIPDTQFDSVVLRCQRTDGKVLDFVLPMTSMSGVWSRLSRSGGQVKFNVKRRNGTYQLQVPGGSPLDIDRFLGQYDALG